MYMRLAGSGKVYALELITFIYTYVQQLQRQTYTIIITSHQLNKNGKIILKIFFTGLRWI